MFLLFFYFIYVMQIMTSAQALLVKMVEPALTVKEASAVFVLTLSKGLLVRVSMTPVVLLLVGMYEM